MPRQGAGPVGRGRSGEDGIDLLTVCDSNCLTSERGNPVLAINSPGSKPMSLKSCHLGTGQGASVRHGGFGKHRKATSSGCSACSLQQGCLREDWHFAQNTASCAQLEGSLCPALTAEPPRPGVDTEMARYIPAQGASAVRRGTYPILALICVPWASG